MTKRDYRTLTVKANGSELNKLETFVDGICDEFNIYSDYYANLVLSMVSLYEQLSINQSLKSEIQIDFFTGTNGLNFEFFTENEKFLREISIVLEERDSIIDDDTYNWLFILDHLSDHLEIGEKSIVLQFDVKSINAELSSARSTALRAYLQGKLISKENYLN